jgi:hypothetical protein
VSIEDARIWLIKASLSMTALTFIFFIIAPAVGYPLTFEQAIRQIEIVSPVFVGYLGSATVFTFSHTKIRQLELSGQSMQSNLSLIVKGPIYVAALGIAVVLVAFGYSNRLDAPQGIGMTLDAFSAALAAVLSLLTVTTNAAVAYLFTVEKKGRK